MTVTVKNRVPVWNARDRIRRLKEALFREMVAYDTPDMAWDQASAAGRIATKHKQLCAAYKALALAHKRK